MALPIGYCRATLLFGGGAQPTGAAVVLGFDNGTAGAPAIVGDAIYQAWQAECLPLQNDTTDFVGVLVKFGPESVGPSGLFSEVNSGGATGSAATPNVAYLAHKNTLLGGRQGRGRMYIPGVSEDDVDGAGNLDTGVVTAWTDALEEFFGACAFLGLEHVLLHGDELTPTPVANTTCDGRVATQRRRLRR